MTKHVVCFDKRPEFVPDNWIIWNAPRPMYGSELSVSSQYFDPRTCHGTWKGDYLTGIFYAAVNPDDPYAVDWNGHNARDNGVVVEYTTTEYARSWMATYYDCKHGEKMGHDKVRARVAVMADHQIMEQYARIRAEANDDTTA